MTPELIAVLPEWVLTALITITSIVGGASLIVDGLERFAKITPSTKDDYYVSLAKKRLGAIAVVLDKIALNKRGQ